MLDHSETYRQIRFKNIGHIYRLKNILLILSEIILQGKSIDFCDVGCSNGYITNMIKERFKINSVWGLDHSGNIDLAKKKYPEIHFERIDLNIINDPVKKFDVVTCFETLEHVGNLENALINLLDMVKSGGAILITVPIEHGVVGIVKFFIKMYFFKYSLDEIGVDRRIYLKSLLLGQRISQYRGEREGYGTHFGFDYRDVDGFLKKKHIPFKASNKVTSRFYLINNV